MDNEELQVQWFHTGSLKSGRYNIPAQYLTVARNVAILGSLVILAILVASRGRR